MRRASNAEAAPAGATRAELEALLRKYTTLARWRRAKDHDVEAATLVAVPDASHRADLATAPQLRDLATEFPGCLRELDRLGQAELDCRVEHLRTLLARHPESAAEDHDKAGPDDGGSDKAAGAGDDDAWIRVDPRLPCVDASSAAGRKRHSQPDEKAELAHSKQEREPTCKRAPRISIDSPVTRAPRLGSPSMSHSSDQSRRRQAVAWLGWS